MNSRLFHPLFGGFASVISSQGEVIGHHFVHLNKSLCTVRGIRGVYKTMGERRLRTGICAEHQCVSLVGLVKVDQFPYHFHE